MTMEQVRNVLHASDLARPNLLVNGGQEIWQRGNGPFTTDQGMTADRWQISAQSMGSFSVVRDTTNTDTSPVAAAVTYTRSSGGGAYQQKVENGLEFRGKTVSVSYRVRCSTPNAVRAGLYDGTWRYGSYHTGDGTWQTLTHTFALYGALTLFYTCVDFQASCTAYVDNAMLVVGAQPADYVPLHPADDLARCLRYYEIISSSNGVGLASGYAHGPGSASAIVWFKVPKAVVPTLTFSALAGWATTASGGNALACTSNPGSFFTGVDRMHLGVTVASGLVAGNGTTVCSNASSTAAIYVEANP